MRVLIVDDEPLARKRIRSLLQGAEDIEILEECRDGEEAVRAITRERPDLVFLDVQMPGIDGFGVLARIDPWQLPVVIFVTAYDQYAIKAFEVHALDYLLKPFDRERFQMALTRARAHLLKADVAARQLLSMLESLKKPPVEDKRILIKSGGKAYFLSTADIDWIESAGNYVTIHTGSDRHLLRETMKGMERRLDPRVFKRIHRHVIVNANRIKELRTWFQKDYKLTLRDGTTLMVTRRYRQNLDGAL